MVAKCVISHTKYAGPLANVSRDDLLCDKIRYSNNEPLAENATSGVARTKNTSTASADPWPLSHHERTVMAPRRDRCLRYALVLLSQLHNIFLVSATTTVHFYTDASCKNLFATIETDTDVGNGQCGEFSISINSASSVFVNNGCGGIYLSTYLLKPLTHSLTSPHPSSSSSFRGGQKPIHFCTVLTIRFA